MSDAAKDHFPDWHILSADQKPPEDIFDNRRNLDHVDKNLEYAFEHFISLHEVFYETQGSVQVPREHRVNCLRQLQS
jgi:hypothetical protein